MEFYEALTMLRDKAFRDPELRERLLDTRNSNTPLSDFCRLSTQAGIELYEMDLLSAVYLHTAGEVAGRAIGFTGHRHPMEGRAIA